MNAAVFASVLQPLAMGGKTHTQNWQLATGNWKLEARQTGISKLGELGELGELGPSRCSCDGAVVVRVALPSRVLVADLEKQITNILSYWLRLVGCLFIKASPAANAAPLAFDL